MKNHSLWEGLNKMLNMLDEAIIYATIMHQGKRP